MKLSRKFVSDYIDLPNDDIKTIAEKMTSVGNEYDEQNFGIRYGWNFRRFVWCRWLVGRFEK